MDRAQPAAQPRSPLPRGRGINGSPVSLTLLRLSLQRGPSIEGEGRIQQTLSFQRDLEIGWPETRSQKEPLPGAVASSGPSPRAGQASLHGAQDG